MDNLIPFWKFLRDSRSAVSWIWTKNLMSQKTALTAATPAKCSSQTRGWFSRPPGLPAVRKRNIELWLSNIIQLGAREVIDFASGWQCRLKFIASRHDRNVISRRAASDGWADLEKPRPLTSIRFQIRVPPLGFAPNDPPLLPPPRRLCFHRLQHHPLRSVRRPTTFSVARPVDSARACVSLRYVD